MELKEIIQKMSELKKHHKAHLVELTLFDDGSGQVFIDYDDSDKENIESQFVNTEGLKKLLEIPEKGGQEDK